MPLEYSQFAKLVSGFEQAEAQFSNWLNNFLLAEAVRVLALTRKATPVDTGLLRRSWSISSVEKSGDTIAVFLVNPVEYAAHVEYGTMLRTGIHMAEISIQKIVDALPGRFTSQFDSWLGGLIGK